MRRTVPVVVAPLALLLPACGADGPSAGGASTAPEEPLPVVSELDPGQLYEGNGMVCDDGTRGPMQPVIEIGVVADVGGKAQAAPDARYGPGVVRLLPALKPVS